MWKSKNRSSIGSTGSFDLTLWNLRTTRLAAILAYLQEMTAQLPHWVVYKDALAQLAVGVEHHRG